MLFHLINLHYFEFFRLQNICLVAFGCLGVVSAGTLEWPANLVSLGSSKSSLASVPLPVNEESIELATESSLSAEQQQQSAEEVEAEDLQSGSSASAAAEPLVDARRLVSSTVPVSVPLPLLVAARSGLRTVLTIQEPTLARVGNLVEHVPTAVSHQSQTVVHDHRRLVTPIVAPAVRTTQVVRQQQPSPLIWTVASDPRLVLLRN